MDYKQLLHRLKEVLLQQLPDEQEHARWLSEILGVQLQLISLKLKGDITFSVEELLKISRALSVSPGTLLDDYSCGSNHPMELVVIENMSKRDRYAYAMDTTYAIFEQVGKAANSKFTAVCKNLPFISYFYYKWLMKFAYLKWLYFSNKSADIVPLSELICPDAYREMKDVYVEAFHSISRLVFIVDGDLILNYIRDLDFFYKTGLITYQEILFVLDDLKNLLVVAEKICRKDFSSVPEQEIQIFYSEMPLCNDIYLVENNTMNLGIFYAQGFNPIMHNNPQTFYVLRDWVDGWIRCSSLICNTEKQDGSLFFKKQHRLLDEYRNDLGWSAMMGKSKSIW